MELREKDRKSLTVSSIINMHEKIYVDDDLKRGKYKQQLKQLIKKDARPPARLRKRNHM